MNESVVISNFPFVLIRVMEKLKLKIKSKTKFINKPNQTKGNLNIIITEQKEIDLHLLG